MSYFFLTRGETLSIKKLMLVNNALIVKHRKKIMVITRNTILVSFITMMILLLRPVTVK
jgi:hypothetical protein